MTMSIFDKYFKSEIPKDTNSLIIKFIIISILYMLIFFTIYGPIVSSIEDEKEKKDMKWITLSIFLTTTILFFLNERFLRIKY